MSKTQDLIVKIKNDLFFSAHMCDCGYVNLCDPHAFRIQWCRRGHWIPWNGTYRQL